MKAADKQADDGEADLRKALAVFTPIIAVLISVSAYFIYMDCMVVSTLMVGELVSSNEGAVQTTQNGFLVDGFLDVPEGRDIEIRTYRSGSKSLCTIPPSTEFRTVCLRVLDRDAK